MSDPERSSLRLVGSGEDPLFRQFLAGDAAAIELARRAVRSTIAARGYRIPLDERPDLAQDALIDVWRAVSATGFSFHNSFEGLVRSIASRRCIDWRRRKRWTVPLEVDVREQRRSPEQQLADSEEIALAQQVLSRMRESCHELFKQHCVESKPYRQLAQEQGRSEVALRQQMSECLRHARTLMSKLRRPAR
jgi:RNA polymerase sigma factor (sigma-70 family)